MRRLILSLLCVFPLYICAENILSLSAVSGHPGDTLTVTATLVNSDAVTALQADIPLNQHLRYLESSALLSSARSNGHALYAAASKDTLHVTIISVANNALVGSSGDIFSFRVILGNEPATYALSPQVTLSDNNAQSLAASTSAGSVTLLSPKIQVTTTTIDYGHIPIRATYSQTLNVRNIGNEPLHITNMVFSAPEFSVESCAFTISAGSSQNIIIQFAPQLHGTISETVRLRSDAINDANVYGANLAVLNADPYSVNELHVQPASGISDDTVTVTLRMNNMETDIAGVQVAFKLPQQLEYIANSVVPLERAQNLSAASMMSNDTLMLMLYSAGNISIADTDGDLLTFRLRLNGKSGSYRLQPLNTILSKANGQNMVSAVYAANVNIQSPTISAAASLNFGSIPVTRSDTVSYSVRNSGQAPLTVERATFLMDGFRVITPMPVTLARNASETLLVEYTPSVEGSFSTTMQLYSNDPACRMKSVAVNVQVFEPNTLNLTGEQTSEGDYLLFAELDNYTPIAGIQFDITCPEGLTPQPFVLSNRMQGFSVTTQPLNATTWRVLIYSFNNVVVPAGTGPIGSFCFTTANIADYNGENVSISTVVLSDKQSKNRFTGTEPQWTIRYLATGDVNEDGIVNVMDATALIGAYLKGTTDALSSAVADVNHDGVINVMDATEIINIYLHNR